MGTLLTKIRTVIYQATVVANARYRGDVLNLQAMGLTYSTLLSLVPSCGDVFRAESVRRAKRSGTLSGPVASAARGRSITGDQHNHQFCRKHARRHTGRAW